MKIFLPIILPLLWAIALTGCRRDMFNQPKSNPLRESDFFPDAAASRPIPPHTVSLEDPLHSDSFSTGMNGTNFVATFPFSVNQTVLQRGKQNFEIYCAPCHGLTGDGDGIVVQRGLGAPSSFNSDRLRSAPAGHFVAAVARGYGAMLPQAAQVTAADRWAIAAYIRALQLSQHTAIAGLPAYQIAKLRAEP
jgi:mono/diheme cytochrome c family protein